MGVWELGNGGMVTLGLKLGCEIIPTPPQEVGLLEVKKEMAVEIYDIDAVKSQLGEVLDEFINDLG